jgi:hypothetical protein
MFTSPSRLASSGAASGIACTTGSRRTRGSRRTVTGSGCSGAGRLTITFARLCPARSPACPSRRSSCSSNCSSSTPSRCVPPGLPEGGPGGSPPSPRFPFPVAPAFKTCKIHKTNAARMTQPKSARRITARPGVESRRSGQRSPAAWPCRPGYSCTAENPARRDCPCETRPP